MSRSAIVIAMSFVVLGLSGCIGGETPDTGKVDEDAPVEPLATADSGSITGAVISQSLEELAAVRIELVKGDLPPVETVTDDKGLYTVNDIAPGTYILQASKPTYKQIARSVEINANEVLTINIEMERLSDSELGVTYVDGPNDMGGLLSCGAGVFVAEGLPRGSINPCGYDPNARNVFNFEVGEGLKTLLVGVTWKPTGGVSGEKLNVGVETNESDEVNPALPAYRYAYVTDSPDIVIRVDNDDITEPEWSWSNITGSQTIEVRVFPGQTSPPTATYQQQFTVWWEAWYNGEAPEGRDPIPED